MCGWGVEGVVCVDGGLREWCVCVPVLKSYLVVCLLSRGLTNRFSLAGLLVYQLQIPMTT